MPLRTIRSIVLRVEERLQFSASLISEWISPTLFGPSRQSSLRIESSLGLGCMSPYGDICHHRSSDLTLNYKHQGSAAAHLAWCEAENPEAYWPLIRTAFKQRVALSGRGDALFPNTCRLHFFHGLVQEVENF